MFYQMCSDYIFHSTQHLFKTTPFLISRYLKQYCHASLNDNCMRESKHGNTILHMETEHISGWWRIEEEKVSDHGENKNSRLHTGNIRRGWLKRKQLEIPGYIDTKPILIGNFVFDVTNDSSSWTTSTQISPYSMLLSFSLTSPSFSSFRPLFASLWP